VIAPKHRIVSFANKFAPTKSRSVSAEGVGVWLADDLPGTGSKTQGSGWSEACPRSCDFGVSGSTEMVDFRAAAHPIAGKPSSYGLRPESER